MTTTDTTQAYVPRLKLRYVEEIRPRLQEQLGLGNIMQVPRLAKRSPAPPDSPCPACRCWR